MVFFCVYKGIWGEVEVKLLLAMRFPQGVESEGEVFFGEGEGVSLLGHLSRPSK